jgi:hypothetical protein
MQAYPSYPYKSKKKSTNQQDFETSPLKTGQWPDPLASYTGLLPQNEVTSTIEEQNWNIYA